MDNRTGSLSAPDAPLANDRDTEPRVRAIRSEIDRTRGDLAETVEAIQEKLRPGNLVSSAASATTEKVKNMAHQAADSAEEWWDATEGNGIIGRMRANPVPTMLAAAGLAWLALADGRSRRRSSYRGSAGAGSYGDRSASADYGNSPESAYGSVGPSGTQSRRPRPNGQSMQSAFRQGRRRFETMIEEYPLAVGVAALILGTTVGLTVPETERENEMMGEARDTAVMHVQEAASSAVGHVKEAAADVVTRAVVGD